MSTSVTTPERLYKYQSFNEYSEDNLRNRRIYFPTPSELNDPFDCNVPVNIVDSNSEELETVFQMLFKKAENRKAASTQYFSNGIPNEIFREDIQNLAKK